MLTSRSGGKSLISGLLALVAGGTSFLSRTAQAAASAATRSIPALGRIPRFLSAGFLSGALSAAFMVPNTAKAGIIISEVAPWSSGNSSLAADWFELTNTGASAVNITGWKMDDNSFAFANAVALNGITSITAGESVIFIELGSGHTAAGDAAAFKTLWFGANPPAGLQIGSYGGSGVGLSTSADGVIIFNSSGVQQAKVSFGTSPTGTFPTFDNAAGLDNTTISALSVVGTHGAFVAANDSKEIGSPGTIGSAGTAPPTLTAAASATVDVPFVVTFTDNATWRAAITGVTVGGSNLTAGYSVAAGMITFTPSASVPANLLQNTDGKSIAVSATGYSDATVTQTIGVGAANKLAITTQPAAPAVNGGSLATQPVVTLVDQYGNLTASTANVTATVGAGTWTLGGTTAKAAAAGTVTFADLTATSATGVTGATISFDSLGLTGITSSSFNISSPTVPPTVSMIAPSNNASFIAPASITITADAADSDGTVGKVEFFNGTTKLGEAPSAPYTYNWSGVAVGDYTLTARATDNVGASTTSAAVVVHVLANQPPTISQTAPADLASVATPATNLALSLTDPEAQPLTVTFYGREKTATAGADFTLVTLPDTQFYTSNTSYFSNFTAQTQWIVAQRNALNIAFVSHMGDMTDGSTAPEFARGDTAMKIIEEPVTMGLPSGIPWGGAPGNHDNTSDWDTTFGPSRFAGRPYFQGNYPTGSAVNSYQFFSAGGMDFLHINLTMAPSAAAIAWADGILKANPNRRAILTSHSILNAGGSQTTWTAEGTTIYEALKGNPNLFLMLCGHNHGIGRRVDTYNGNTIYSVLQDYQSEANGGDSWLRYFTFSPANNKITTYVIRCTDGSRRTDSESQFDMTYNMQGSAPWTTLGTVNVAAAGTNASLPWTNLKAGTHYEWYATVTDGVTPVTSATRSFTAATPPTLALTAPANNASFIAPATVTLTATAADSDGTVSKVEFFDGSSKIGEDTSAPYSFDWTNVAAGDHTLTAKATDNIGLATVSSPVVIHVAAKQTYTLWAAANAPGQAADQNNNNDGVPNGVKYFMGADGSSPTINPGIVKGAITWPKSSLFVGTYVVEVSSDLANWEPADKHYADHLTDYSTSVEFSLPSAANNLFVRLRVVPTP